MRLCRFDTVQMKSDRVTFDIWLLWRTVMTIERRAKDKHSLNYGCCSVLLHTGDALSSAMCVALITTLDFQILNAAQVANWRIGIWINLEIAEAKQFKNRFSIDEVTFDVILNHKHWPVKISEWVDRWEN